MYNGFPFKWIHMDVFHGKLPLSVVSHLMNGGQVLSVPHFPKLPIRTSVCESNAPSQTASKIYFALSTRWSGLSSPRTSIETIMHCQQFPLNVPERCVRRTSNKTFCFNGHWRHFPPTATLWQRCHLSELTEWINTSVTVFLWNRPHDCVSINHRSSLDHRSW